MRVFCRHLLAVMFLMPTLGAVWAAEKAPMLGIGHFETPAWFRHSFLDLRDDLAEARDGGRRLILLFHQDACPYCAKLIQYNLSQRPIVVYLREHFEVIEINLWGSREVTGLGGEILDEAEFARRNKVWFTPTLLFLNESGGVVFRMNGYYGPERFLRVLQYVGGGHYKEGPYRDWVRTGEDRSAHPGQGGLKAEVFFASAPYRLDGPGVKAVFFEQTDCPQCDALHLGPLRKPATRRMLEGVQAVQLDRWSQTPVVTPEGRATTARQWADELGLTYLPAVVFFDGQREVIRSEAMFKTFHFQSMLAYAISGDYRAQPEFQRYIHQRAERLREQGITVDLWD